MIIAIGAQNAFVLRQGIRRERVLLVVSLCALIDAALIAIGVGGVGMLIALSPTLTRFSAWGGAIFLFWYGLLAFRAALSPKALDPNTTESDSSLRSVVLTTLAVSLLNPHVYLDTVVLVGSLAAQYPADTRPFFAIGAILASLSWFFSLGYGARLLAPLFTRPAAWRILDLLVGVVMWVIAWGLLPVF